MKIAICGAGPSGLTLGSILLKEGGSNFELDVFEKYEKDRDQGAGWDVDAKGRKALQRAGVQLDKISRQGSDTFRVFKVGEPTPFTVMNPPGFIKRMREPEPETNRTVMIESLLATFQEHKNRARIHWTTSVNKVIASSDNSKQVKLMGGKQGEISLGVFDLVVDASGVGSRLRRYIIAEDEVGTAEDKSKETGMRNSEAYTELVMLLGIIEDPEADFPASLLRKLGQGTLAFLGENQQGYTCSMILQRFGAELSDHRTSFGIMLHRPHLPTFLEELGLPTDHREVLTTAKTKEDLNKVKSWIKGYLGESWEEKEGLFQAVDSVTSLAVRPLWHFPSDPTFLETGKHLPLICIGDALHALPPYTGSSGNFALHDANDFADFLLPILNGNSNSRARASLISQLRRIERNFLDRTKAISQRGRKTQQFHVRLQTQKNMLKDLTVNTMLRGDGWTPKTLLIAGFHWVNYTLNKWEGFGMDQQQSST